MALPQGLMRWSVTRLEQMIQPDLWVKAAFPEPLG
jgi:hypothetical protein